MSGGFLNDDKTTEHIGKEQVQDIVDDDVVTYILDHDNKSDKEPIQCKHCHRFGHDKSNVLIFTHANFVGRQIIPQYGAKSASGNKFILNG